MSRVDGWTAKPKIKPKSEPKSESETESWLDSWFDDDGGSRVEKVLGAIIVLAICIVLVLGFAGVFDGFTGSETECYGASQSRYDPGALTHGC
jgi:hypothetical protein